MSVQATRSELSGRPLMVTLISIGLMLVGIGANVSFAGPTFKAVAQGMSMIDLTFKLYLHVLWIALFIAGLGLFKGNSWGRSLLGVTLLGLLLMTVIDSFEWDVLALHLFVYCVLIWLLFRPQANAYFARPA